MVTMLSFRHLYQIGMGFTSISGEEARFKYLPIWRRGEIGAAKYLVSSRGDSGDFFVGAIVRHCKNHWISREKGFSPHQKFTK
jgi:hypothetical protein